MAMADTSAWGSPLADTLADLYARVPRGARLGLEPMRAACKRFGHPERAFEAVHVAGTNGKGSTCALVESIAHAMGKKAGMYTSPHLCRFAERIRIGGQAISDDALVEVLGDVLRLAPELSFFETATLTAFVAFRAANVDVAVVEVGLGGRLDATNVIPPPRASAITRIAFDHMDRLGTTLVEIAREKAGIAKPGMDILLGDSEMPAEVYAAIASAASEAGATVTRVQAPGTIAELSALDVHVAPYAPLELAYRLGERIGATPAERLAGIRAARWAGRYETITTRDGTYLLDAAHNPDGAHALARALDRLGVTVAGQARTPRDAPFALVFGALSDKAWPEMLDIVAPPLPHRFYVAPPVAGGGREAAPPEELARRHPGVICSAIPESLERARAAVGSNGVVVACGSIFVVGETRATLLGLPRDPAVAL